MSETVKSTKMCMKVHTARGQMNVIARAPATAQWLIKETWKKDYMEYQEGYMVSLGTNGIAGNGYHNDPRKLEYFAYNPDKNGIYTVRQQCHVTKVGDLEILDAENKDSGCICQN